MQQMWILLTGRVTTTSKAGKSSQRKLRTMYMVDAGLTVGFYNDQHRP